jgi:hypothetical protein
METGVESSRRRFIAEARILFVAKHEEFCFCCRFEMISGCGLN